MIGTTPVLEAVIAAGGNRLVVDLNTPWISPLTDFSTLDVAIGSDGSVSATAVQRKSGEQLKLNVTGVTERFGSIIGTLCSNLAHRLSWTRPRVTIKDKRLHISLTSIITTGGNADVTAAMMGPAIIDVLNALHTLSTVHEQGELHLKIGNENSLLAAIVAMADVPIELADFETVADMLGTSVTPQS